MFEYSVDRKRRRGLVTFSGDVTEQDLLEAINRQLADGAWAAYSVIYDCLSVSKIPTLEELQSVSRYLPSLTMEHGPRGAIAVVSRSEELQPMLGMSRSEELQPMLGMYADRASRFG